MLFIKIVGIVSGVIGLMLLFAPKVFIKLNDTANKVRLEIDSKCYNLRVGIGISLVMVSLTMFFIIYYMAQKFGLR